MLRAVSAALALAVARVTPRHARIRRRPGRRTDLSLLLRNEDGASVLEFAIVAPAVVLIGLGMLKFGVAMANYLVLTNSAAQGALTLALSRGTSTPYTTTTTAITNAAPSLTSGQITTVVKINDVACSTDAGCSSALVAGQTALVQVTYPCDLTVMGINFKPGGCTLSAQSSQMVQ